MAENRGTNLLPILNSWSPYKNLKQKSHFHSKFSDESVTRQFEHVILIPDGIKNIIDCKLDDNGRLCICVSVHVIPVHVHKGDVLYKVDLPSNNVPENYEPEEHDNEVVIDCKYTEQNDSK
jgi:hypothetical protein